MKISITHRRVTANIFNANHQNTYQNRHGLGSPYPKQSCVMKKLQIHPLCEINGSGRAFRISVQATLQQARGARRHVNKAHVVCGQELLSEKLAACRARSAQASQHKPVALKDRSFTLIGYNLRWSTLSQCADHTNETSSIENNFSISDLIGKKRQ